MKVKEAKGEDGGWRGRLVLIKFAIGGVWT